MYRKNYDARYPGIAKELIALYCAAGGNDMILDLPYHTNPVCVRENVVWSRCSHLLTLWMVNHVDL